MTACPVKNGLHPSVQRPTNLFFWAVGEESNIILEGAKMPLGIDERLHVIGVEVKIFVIRETT